MIMAQSRAQLVGVTIVEKDKGQVWNRVVSRLRAELGEEIFTSWFGRVEFESLDEGVLKLSVPTRFLRKWLVSHYYDKVMQAARAEFEKLEEAIQSVVFSVRQPVAVKDSGEVDVSAKSATQTRGAVGLKPAGGIFNDGTDESFTEYEGFQGSPLDKRFTFESFVTGGSNRLAFAAAKQVAEQLGKTMQFNPLYVHSTVGLGKTHLLHAIAWDVTQRLPQARVLYLTAERFMYSFIDALRTRDALAFKDKLRGIDILLIDDMEFLQGKATQQEFGHTLNSLIDSNKQVIVASDRAPTQLESLDARMRSRLGGGLVVEIEQLDFDLRLQIIRRRVEDKIKEDPNFVVHDEVVGFLAERLTESGRELDGAVNRIYANSQFTNEPITLTAVEHIIRDLMCSKEPRRIKIDDILRVISRHYGVTRSDILSERRNRSIVLPRQVGMYLAKRLTARSLPEIGRRFGGRDHTTVLHAIRKIEKEISGNQTLREDLGILERLLKD